MLNEEIRKFVKAQPFAPFDIELVTGRVLAVDHPDFVLVPPVREGRYFVFVDRRDGVPETVNSNLALIVRPAEGRGHAPKRRRQKGSRQ